MLAERVRLREIMDQPDLDARRHRDALGGLARLNLVSRSAGILWPPIARLSHRIGNRPLRVLDLAAGGGDVPIRLWQKANRKGVRLEVVGIDRSPQATEYSRQQAAKRRAAVEFLTSDLLGQELPRGFDVVTCSLFLHHLDDEQALRLLTAMARAAGRLVLVNDLERGPLNLALVTLGAWLLGWSDVVRSDAARSVRAAFSLEEARGLARGAGLEGATVERRWPCRYLLFWTKP